MASVSYWLVSPGMFLALLGKARGWKRGESTPTVDWRTVAVDIVIPAKNEESSIGLCLASLFAQDFPIRSVHVVDDGSTDRTSDAVKSYCEISNHDVHLIRREESIGKTPTIREIAQSSDADAIFVIDADTVLTDHDYISRVVEELFRNAGVASVCGQVTPLTSKRRAEIIRSRPELQHLSRKNGGAIAGEDGRWRSLLTTLTVLYRKALYVYLQRILYDGHLKLFGTQLNPVGCAVVYKTSHLRECFEYAHQRVGDNLTMSEDIYIGHYFNWKGYRNVQVATVSCESTEPTINRLPHQMFLWSSAFYQSVHYFKELPLFWYKRVLRRLVRAVGWKAGPDGTERRKIQEEYRSPWGGDFTRREGRPVGILNIASIIEKVTYPAILIILALFYTEAFFITVLAEAAGCSLLVLLASGPGGRWKVAGMMFLSTPVRVVSLGIDLLAFLRYLLDLVRGNRRWRK